MIYGKRAIRMDGIFRKRIFQVKLDKHQVISKNVLKKIQGDLWNRTDFAYIKV